VRFHILLPPAGAASSAGRSATRGERNFARRKRMPKMFPTPFRASFSRCYCK
jgi:hypothetical protein